MLLGSKMMSLNGHEISMYRNPCFKLNHCPYGHKKSPGAPNNHQGCHLKKLNQSVRSCTYQTISNRKSLEK